MHSTGDTDDAAAQVDARVLWEWLVSCSFVCRFVWPEKVLLD